MLTALLAILGKMTTHHDSSEEFADALLTDGIYYPGAEPE